MSQELNRIYQGHVLGVINAWPAEFVQTVVTSPPYFSKEKYSEEDTQSWVRYKTIEEWTEGFLLAMFKINALILKPGGVFAVNIADVNVNGKVVPLESLTVECGRRAGIPLEETLRFEMPHRTGTHAAKFTADEPVFMFRKPA